MAEWMNDVEKVIQQCPLFAYTSVCSCKRSNQFPISRLYNDFSTQAEENETLPQRKLLKVAILGRPNAGKSTLINQILGKNVCDVSSKTHTTRFPIRTAFISEGTQIIFVDTPGVVTKKEFSRFCLTKSFLNWRENLLKEIDMVGVILEAPFVNQTIKFHSVLNKYLEGLDESKPVFLILNKIDMVKNKTHLLEATNKIVNELGKDELDENSTKEQKVSKIFFVSALKNKGVRDVVQYLLEEAKECDNWIMEEGKVCDAPLNVLITNLLRAKIMNILPQEIPYLCRYEVEYLEESNLGEIICVALVTCKYLKHQVMLTKKKKNFLKILSQEIESDLYKILKRNVRLRIVVCTRKAKKPLKRL